MSKKKKYPLAQAFSLLLWCFSMFFSDSLPLSLSLFCGVLLHECGHLLAAAWLSVPFDSIQICPLGLRLCPCRPFRFFEQCLVALAGPLVNLFSAALMTFCFGFTVPAALHLFLALLNLLPIVSLDGGQILEALLGCFMSCAATYRICRIVSLFALAFGLLLSLGLLWILGQGSYLFFFFFSLFLMHIFSEKSPVQNPTKALRSISEDFIAF